MPREEDTVAVMVAGVITALTPEFTRLRHIITARRQAAVDHHPHHRVPQVTVAAVTARRRVEVDRHPRVTQVTTFIAVVLQVVPITRHP